MFFLNVTLVTHLKKSVDFLDWSGDPPATAQ